MTGNPLMEVVGVSKHFPSRRNILQDISLTLYQGETTGLMGRSGGGKSTLAKIITGLLPPDAGQILYKGRDLCKLDRGGWKAVRPQVMMVFQDYRQSLTPNMRAGEILTESLTVNRLAAKGEAVQIVRELMESCGLPQSIYGKYPKQLSGGEAQRVALIRAIALKPSLLILDEVTSGLDQNTAASIMNLICRKCEENNAALLLISHDEEQIRIFSERVFLLEDGILIPK